MSSDLVDPRRADITRDLARQGLERFGETLANIHALPLHWTRQVRGALESLDNRAKPVDDPDAATVVNWLVANAPTAREITFVHGDYNVANVLLDAGSVAAVLDWEYAGLGWKEYEIAWALRARTHFLDNEVERCALLEGYRRTGSFDSHALRWCETLNYLHFATWSGAANPAYRRFALDHAIALTRDDGE